MALVGAYRHHRDALRASLRAVYGVDLRRPGMSVLDLADLVAHLPPGCALWRATGGPLAWTDEMHLSAATQHTIAVLHWGLAGGKAADRPEPITPPESEAETRARQARLLTKREKFLARARTRRATT